MSQIADPKRGRAPSNEEKGKGEAESGDASKDKERKDRRSVTAQPKKAPPMAGNIVGALIKEAEIKGRNHLREVEDKRLSMMGATNIHEQLRSALDEGEKPKPSPQASKPGPSPTPTNGPTPSPQPSRINRGSIRDKEQDKKKEEQQTSIQPETNGGDKARERRPSKEASQLEKERPTRTASFKGRPAGADEAAAASSSEDGKATFSKAEVQKYKEEMIRRYEEEEAQHGRKKRVIPPGPGAGAPAPPPRTKPAEGSPVVARKEEEGPASPEKMKRLRQNVIDELLNTEADYIRDLKIILSLYHNPLKSLNILESQEFQCIFSNFNIILNVSQEVEAEFQKMKDSDSVLVGKTFLKVADYLKMYTQYCSNQEICIKTLDSLEKKNKQFAQFLDDCALNPQSRGMSMNAFLIKPIQRICKYPLLLKELIKYTPEEDQDYNDLKAALEKVSAVVNVVNKKKSETENLQTLLEIQGQIAGGQDLHLIEPGRLFIMEATFNKVSGGKCQERHFFLFNDMMLYVASSVFGTIKGGNIKEAIMGAQVRKKYVLKGQVSFQKALIRDVEDEGAIRNAFDIIQLEGAKKVITICCNSPEEKKAWMTEIEEKIETFLQKEMVRRQEEETKMKNDLAAAAAVILAEKAEKEKAQLSAQPATTGGAANSPVGGPKKIGRTRTRLPTQVLDAVPLDAAFEEMTKEEDEEQGTPKKVPKRRPAGIVAPAKSLPSLPPTAGGAKPPSPQSSAILPQEPTVKPPSPQSSAILGEVKKPASPKGSDVRLTAEDIESRGLQRSTSSSLIDRLNARLSGGVAGGDPRSLQRSNSERSTSSTSSFDGTATAPSKLASPGSPGTGRKAPPIPSKETKPGRGSQIIPPSQNPTMQTNEAEPEQQQQQENPKGNEEKTTIESSEETKDVEANKNTETQEGSGGDEDSNKSTEQNPTESSPTEGEEKGGTESPTPTSPREGNGEHEDPRKLAPAAAVKPGPGGVRSPVPGRTGGPNNNLPGRVSNYRKPGLGREMDALIQNQANTLTQQPPVGGGGGGGGGEDEGAQDPSQPNQAGAPGPGGRGYRSRISYYSPTAVMEDGSGESTTSTRTTRTRPTRGRGRGN